MGIVGLYFSFQGRINRLTGFLATVVLGIVIIPIAAVFGGVAAFTAQAMFAGSALPAAGPIVSSVTFVVVLIVVVGLLWSSTALAVKRLHDMGYTGWIHLGMFIAILATTPLPTLYGINIVNLAYTLALLFWPGNSSSNIYGPAPAGGTNFGTRPSHVFSDLQEVETQPEVARNIQQDARFKSGSQSVTRVARGNPRAASGKPVFGRRG